MQRELIAHLREALAAAQQAPGGEQQGGGGGGRPGSRERLSPLPCAAA
jgi:hypothetical protein